MLQRNKKFFSHYFQIVSVGISFIREKIAGDEKPHGHMERMDIMGPITIRIIAQPL